MEARFEARLHLTDAQKASFREIRAKHQEALAAKRKAAFEAGKTLAKALANPESKPEELKTLHRSAADLAFEARLEQRAMRLEIRAILTPEQREEGARMEGRMEGMMMSRGAGHWHEGGMGGGMKGCPPAQAK
jgi:Spy/CpxP family protein refolding chaperone